MSRIFTIKSPDSGKEYQVVDGDNGWTCTCPHWTFRLKGRAACKHIDHAKTHDRRMELAMQEFEGVDFTVDLSELIEQCNKAKLA